MKIKSREVEESNSRGVLKPNQKVNRDDADGLSLFDSQLSTLDFSTRIGHNGPLSQIASVSNATLSIPAASPPTVFAAAGQVDKPRRLRNVA